MKQRITYTEKLDIYVEEEHLIPYRLHKNSRYRNNCYYWIDADDKWLKVEEVLYNFNTTPNPTLDHINAMYMDNLQAYLTTDLTIYDFRLERDKFNIRERDTLININESFAGGEIEYWFFKHHITLANKEYIEFWKFFDPYDKQCIDPNKFYFIKAKLVKGIWRGVIFEPDPTRVKFGKNVPEREVFIPGRCVRKNDIENERRRRKSKHENKK